MRLKVECKIAMKKLFLIWRFFLILNEKTSLGKENHYINLFDAFPLGQLN